MKHFTYFEKYRIYISLLGYLIFSFGISIFITVGIMRSLNDIVINYVLLAISCFMIFVPVIFLLQFYYISMDFINKDILVVTGKLSGKYTDINPFLRKFEYYFVLDGNSYSIGAYYYAKHSKVKNGNAVTIRKLSKSNITLSVFAN